MYDVWKKTGSDQEKWKEMLLCINRQNVICLLINFNEIEDKSTKP